VCTIVATCYAVSPVKYVLYFNMGGGAHAVAQLVEALCYKSEGRGFIYLESASRRGRERLFRAESE